MGYISFLISHVPPAHSFFQKKPILIRSCFELFEMFFEVKEIFIFFPLLQSDSTAIFLGRSGRN